MMAGNRICNGLAESVLAQRIRRVLRPSRTVVHATWCVLDVTVLPSGSPDHALELLRVLAHIVPESGYVSPVTGIECGREPASEFGGAKQMFVQQLPVFLRLAFEAVGIESLVVHRIDFIITNGSFSVITSFRKYPHLMQVSRKCEVITAKSESQTILDGQTRKPSRQANNDAKLSGSYREGV